MTKIAYLLGAGASAKALPTVKHLEDQILIMADKIKNFNYDSPSKKINFRNRSFTISDLAGMICSDMGEIANGSRDYASIDTFAKKLFLGKDRHDLAKLKAVLMTFFTLEQSQVKTDPRYDTFFASILQNHINDFPTNTKVITWNYDSQFEKSYYEFSGGRTILNVANKFTDNDIRLNEFALINLNGKASVVYDSFNTLIKIWDVSDGWDIGTLYKVFQYYLYIANSEKDYRPGLSFAWENDALIESTKQVTVSTEVLVVIGYSFPYFNRSVDREIIGSMKSLRKIYIQNPEADIVEDRLESILDIKGRCISVKLINKDQDQFILPNEM